MNNYEQNIIYVLQKINIKYTTSFPDVQLLEVKQMKTPNFTIRRFLK
jgi:hypothetical protein